VLRYAEERGVTSDLQEADAELLAFAERLLAGRVGAASARVIVSSISKGEQLRLDELLAIVEETHQIITHSRELEQKSQELQATAEELRIANERLKELDRLKDDFLTTVSHELRTPLTSIRSFSEILVEDTRLDRGRSDYFLAVIASESQRLTRLLDSILDLARLERGGAEWRMEDVDPAGALDDALASMLPLFHQTGVQLDARVEPCTECLWADRDRLVQVFLNLLSNALKFSDPEHGTVSVVGRPGMEGYFASVSDNGRGVALEDQVLIFERFAKGRDAAKRELPGSGLGLAIARHIVGHHGGKIWLRSPSGEGATFCIFLPNRRPRETETASL
jgi:signal transduction histidine kinase